MKKFDCFLENARILNKNFDIVPLLYGSLGLEVLTGTPQNCDDIDILIPDIFFLGEKWQQFKSFLEADNYCLIDLHEHTFKKDNIDYSYAGINDLPYFAHINIQDIPVITQNGISFKLLTLKQYLKVYKSSYKDSYRINIKEKQDLKKIRFIESLIKNNK